MIYDYELTRLHKGIDRFFSAVGEVLLEDKSWTFSSAQEVEKKEQKPVYVSDTIKSFDYEALDEFLNFLGDALFYKTRPYSTRSFMHPINVVQLSGFFEHWNNKLSSSRNSEKAYEKVSMDVQIHYEKTEERKIERQQQMADLKISLLTIFFSVTLSAVVSAVITILLGK